MVFCIISFRYMLTCGRAEQLQHTEGHINTIRTRLRAPLVCVYIYRKWDGGGEGRIEFSRMPLLTNKKLGKTQRNIDLLCVVFKVLIKSYYVL